MTVLFATPGRLDGGFPYGITAVRVRPALAADPYSQRTRIDWSAASEATLTGIGIAPTASADVDSLNGRWVESSHQLWSKAFDLDVEPTDRIRWDGRLWEVTGEGGRWRSPLTGWHAGAVFGMRAVS